MIDFVKWYIKNIASQNEATKEEMIKYLKNHNLLFSDYKLKPKRMDKILAMYPFFSYSKHYYPKSKMDKNYKI